MNTPPRQQSLHDDVAHVVATATSHDAAIKLVKDLCRAHTIEPIIVTRHNVQNALGATIDESRWRRITSSAPWNDHAFLPHTGIANAFHHLVQQLAELQPVTSPDYAPTTDKRVAVAAATELASAHRFSLYLIEQVALADILSPSLADLWPALHRTMELRDHLWFPTEAMNERLRTLASAYPDWSAQPGSTTRP